MMSMTAVLVGVLSAATPWMPVTSAQTGAVTISGDYVEFRTADVFTGPCFANAEIGLTGAEAAMIWHVGTGSWNGVSLDNLSVAAAVRANGTLGDPYAAHISAKSVIIVDARATPEQRAALVDFAQHQAPDLLDDVLAVEAMPIQFNETSHGYINVAVGAGREVAVATRPFHDGDHICFNETAFYAPLAQNLEHAMAVMTVEGQYHGGHLGKTWRDANRRGSYVGNFAVRELQAE
jgi:hypothetical protein